MKDYLDFKGEEYLYEYPTHSPQDARRREGVLLAARLMVNAAFTAPFAGGVPQVEAQIVYGQQEQEKLARKMEELAYANKSWESVFLYEAAMLRESDVIILLGNRLAQDHALDAGCGFCGGRPDCSFFYERKKLRFGALVDSTDRRTDRLINGPMCGARINDLGFAVGSALWMARTLLVDAKPFMSAGLAGQKLGYCPNSGFVVGVMVSALSKNPYVDINPEYHLVNMTKVLEMTRKQYIVPRGVTSFDYRKWVPKPEGGDGKDE